MVVKIKYKRLIKAIGYASLFGGYICFIYIFLSAYLNPMKIVLVDINHFGEATLEMYLIVICIPFVISLFVESFKK
ncbi:hypothetical protein DRJ17_06595 [Candidatus Woesearchaeota archaeon]|nr:MAG: hypothetical protein DRJ17_06595 [Candidatus Woesearchaeota archaeon]